MKTEIVTGTAGSGKSSYLRKNFDPQYVIYHDEWAKDFYKTVEARRIISKHTNRYDITKEELIESLMSYSDFYEDYTELGKKCFIQYIIERLMHDRIEAIEIPFLHRRFHDVTEMFDVELEKVVEVYDSLYDN